MKVKSISIQFPRSQFTDIQLQRLTGLGKVNFIEGGRVKYPKDTELLVVDPDSFGGIAKTKSRLVQLLDTLPNIKYLALDSSDYSYLDLDYCRQKGLIISYVSDYDADSKAEHTIALLLACARRILINDRRTYRRTYKPEPGFEARGKSLGVVGWDSTAERVVYRARAIGMIVYTERRFDEGIRRPLDYLLSCSDMISLHLPDNDESNNFLSKERIRQLKTGSIVVNLGNRMWVDEKAMNEALLTRKVDTYCFEAQSWGKSPLKGSEFALMLKPFNCYTKETQKRNIEAMVGNIDGIATGKPYSKLDF